MRIKRANLHLRPATAGQRHAAKSKIMPLLAMVVVSLMLAGLLAACGGSSGSGTGTVKALTLPNRVELSGSETGSSSSSAASMRSFVPAAYTRAYNDAGTAYSTQETHIWVDDTNALDMVNQILGVIKDTAYNQFLNQGPYLALVREVGETQTSQTGSSGTSTTTEQLMEIVVDVSRTSNNDPMIVMIWVNEDDGPGNQPMLIKGYFTVWAGAGDTYEGVYYPYGKLEAHFKGVDNNDNAIFTMAMSIGDGENGKIQIQYIENCNETDFAFETKVNAIASSDMSEGNAYVYEYEKDGSGECTDIFHIAYNNEYFKEKDKDDNIKVYSRDIDDMTYRVFRYKLFDADDGSAITLNSGFPIRFEKNGSTHHGYIGYYGLWAPVSLADGDEVVGEENGNTYTLVIKGGKLKKHVIKEIGLAKLDGLEMSKWDDSTDTDIVFTYDADTEKFVQIGIRSQDTNWQVVETGAGNIITFGDWDGAWCDSLQAWLPLGTLDSCAPTEQLTYHQEATVMPGSDDFPTADLSFKYWNGSAWVDFTYDVSELMLMNGSTPVVSTSSNDFYMPLVPAADYTANTDNIQTEPGAAFDLDVYYSWSTGSEEWNRLTVLKDSDGDYVSFDAPLKFTYTHATANDINGDSTYDGKTFTLEYDGFSLQVPWAYDADEDEWNPMINLKSGVTLGDSDQYVVKIVEAGLVMSQISDTSVASGLTIDTTVEEPSLDYDAAKTALVGAKPTDVELKVIKGELVE